MNHKFYHAHVDIYDYDSKKTKKITIEIEKISDDDQRRKIKHMHNEKVLRQLKNEENEDMVRWYVEKLNQAAQKD
jgi:hypothetical protein